MVFDLQPIIEQLKSKEIINRVLVVGLPFHTIKGKSRSEIRSLLKSENPKDNFLNEIFKEIDEERIRLITEVEHFYGSNINSSNIVDSNSTFGDVVKLANNYYIQMLKLNLIYSPEFYLSLSTRKGTDSKYDMVKINWINDDGKKYKKYGKNYGKEGKEGIEKSFIKVLEEFLDSTGNPLYEKRFTTVDDLTFTFDFSVEIKGVEWVFEIPSTSKEDFIFTAVILETWKMYKSDYFN